MFKALQDYFWGPVITKLELDYQRQGVDLHTLRHHAQGQAEELKAMGMTNVDLHNQLDELEAINKIQGVDLHTLRHELDAAKKRNRDYMEENEHLLKNLEKAENLVIKVKGDAESKPKEKPELSRLKNSLKGLKIDCMKWKAGQRAWQKHENRMGVKQ